MNKKKEAGLSKKTKEVVALISGFGFILSILIAAFWIECPTEFQYNVFRIILSIFVVVFISVVGIQGELKVAYKIGITATGVSALFVIIYMSNPKEIYDYKKCQSALQEVIVKGKIIDNKTKNNIEGARIRVFGKKIIGEPEAITTEKGFTLQLTFYTDKQEEDIFYEIVKAGYKNKEQKTTFDIFLLNSPLKFEISKKDE